MARPHTKIEFKEGFLKQPRLLPSWATCVTASCAIQGQARLPTKFPSNSQTWEITSRSTSLKPTPVFATCIYPAISHCWGSPPSYLWYDNMAQAQLPSAVST